MPVKTGPIVWGQDTAISDATICWVYGGYQCMLDVKAGPKDMMVALVNAAISNSIQETH